MIHKLRVVRLTPCNHRYYCIYCYHNILYVTLGSLSFDNGRNRCSSGSTTGSDFCTTTCGRIYSGSG